VTINLNQFMKQQVVIDSFQGSPLTDEYAEKIRSSGITAFFTSVSDSHCSLRQTLCNIHQLRETVGRLQDFTICKSARDIRQAKQEDKIGVLITLQDTYCLEYDVELMELLYDLGVRMVQLTANDGNLVGDGCGEPRAVGLSKLGKKLVDILNELGVLIDLSHVGDGTRREVLKNSRAPVAVSHGNARGFCDNVRNVDDDDIRTLAEKGGVIGATTYPTLCTWKEAPKLTDFVDNIEYLVNLVGEDHVGLGLAQVEGVNLDGYLSQYPEMYALRSFPDGAESITAWPDIIQILVERGYSKLALQKIVGSNFLRLYDQVLGEGCDE